MKSDSLLAPHDMYAIVELHNLLIEIVRDTN